MNSIMARYRDKNNQVKKLEKTIDGLLDENIKLDIQIKSMKNCDNCKHSYVSRFKPSLKYNKIYDNLSH